MNEEQKARLAAIEIRICNGFYLGSANEAWLLALVRELDEENARQRQDVAEAEASMRESERNAAHAEQQLAAVAAALKAAGVDGLGLLTEQITRLSADRDGYHVNLQRTRDELNHDVWRLEEERDKTRVEAQRISAEYTQYRQTAEAERDELRHEVERLRTGQSTMRTRIDVEIARAEKAEAERDALKAIVERAAGLDIGSLNDRACMVVVAARRELARLKDGT